MSKIKIGLVGVALLALSACSSAQESSVAGGVTTASTVLASVCSAAAPILQQVQAKNPAASSSTGTLLAYAESVCTVNGAVASTLDPTGTAVTPSWLVGVLDALQLAAELAPIILPAV